MRHVQLPVVTLGIGRRDLPIRHATITVVRRPNRLEPDWEIVAHTVDHEPIAAARHQLILTVVEGPMDDGRLSTSVYRGPAAFVRQVEVALVFRGIGTLDGFDESLLGD